MSRQCRASPGRFRLSWCDAPYARSGSARMPDTMTVASGVAAIDALAAILLARGLCDERAIERARRVAAETDGRLDHVLKQLGLVTERDLASSYAALLDVPLASAERYPADPLLPERLEARFLRAARALPIALEGAVLVLAMADPLDDFTARAVAAASGCEVAIEVAVPIELEAAIERLYP